VDFRLSFFEASRIYRQYSITSLVASSEREVVYLVGEGVIERTAVSRLAQQAVAVGSSRTTSLFLAPDRNLDDGDTHFLLTPPRALRELICIDR
jgi:hypothetical protein